MSEPMCTVFDKDMQVLAGPGPWSEVQRQLLESE